MNDSFNPLFQLSAKQKEDISDLLRAGNDLEVINEQLQTWETPVVSRKDVDEFFRAYSKDRWTRRLDLAAQEADTILALVRSTSSHVPEAILTALGQEAFRQIASGRVKAEDLSKYTSLFLRAKEQDRAERSLHIQTERLRLAQRNATEHALDAFARELPQHPAALEAFQQLKTQLLDQTEHLEDPS